MLTCLCIRHSIQLCKFIKSRKLFTNRKKIGLCVNWKHQ